MTNVIEVTITIHHTNVHIVCDNESSAQFKHRPCRGYFNRDCINIFKVFAHSMSKQNA